MFGLSLAEMAVIVLVALVVIGPKELPTVVRAIVRTLGQLRGMGQEFRRNFDELAREAEIDTLKREWDDAMLPTIIDLDGKPQPTYDISTEKQTDKSRRVRALPTPAEPVEGEGKHE